MTGQFLEEMVDTSFTEEIECKICYSFYNLRDRRPKVLECCHRMCSKCLYKIIDLRESPQNAITCPFCRYETSLPDEAVDNLPDDHNIVATLSLGVRTKRYLQENSAELLLSSKRLTSFVNPSHSSSNCLVITIMEVQREPSPSQGSTAPAVEVYRPSSFDSLASMSRRWTVWNCTSLLCQTLAQIVVWLLGLLYFSSLPLGIYLLVIQKVTLGVIFVSLVPSSLVIVMVYGFCQCLCHEFLDCISS
ncbi:E3 ubiquitin-protein ligase RNF182-like [Acipenser oxyrinchus oxyrinchus]|uniref:E3 ubiquitin-protein ligase RNF182 n=1 Tax=Acipenser oxyrinchus oxyrinchus TaxID=40147 RepID=A0AAD8LSS5_ACIOX|nr:E3 ubiquitin-protein ligase RNF182-like [Acipenser oxyrinchus oxyrinchus]